MNRNLPDKLYAAIIKDNIDLADFLLQANERDLQKTVNTQHDENKETILYAACERGHADIVRKLLTVEGINLNLGNYLSETALHAATRRQNVCIVQLLLNAGAELICDIRGNTALHFAASRGNTEILKYILTFYGDNINDHNDSPRFGEGNTPLHLATSKGHLRAVKLLLKWGAKTEIRNTNQYTPLYIAVSIGKLKIVKALIKSGAKLEKRCKGKTAFELAFEKQDNDIMNFIKKEQMRQRRINQQQQLPLLVTPRDENVAVSRNSMRSRKSHATDIELPDIQFGMLGQSSYVNQRSESELANAFQAGVFHGSVESRLNDIQSRMSELEQYGTGNFPTSRSRRTSVRSLGLQDEYLNLYGSLENRLNEMSSKLSGFEQPLPSERSEGDSLENRLLLLQSRISNLEHRRSSKENVSATDEKENRSTTGNYIYNDIQILQRFSNYILEIMLTNL